MIKFENTEVMNFEGALRGMRNPLNSWDKSDSAFMGEFGFQTYIGEDDIKLAQKLIKAGPDHRKFLRQIFVSVDITAPLYWWKEFDTYKVGTVANSCSTMHTIHKRDITIDDFSVDHLTPFALSILKELISDINGFRREYIQTNDKAYWYNIIQLLPSSYNQKRTVTLNYEILRNIYGARCNHKLEEWSVGFMAWIDTLPYSSALIKCK